MKNQIACFVHKGDRSFLSISVAHAVHAGLKPIVIGDLPSRCQDAEFIDIREFDKFLVTFRDVYKHISVNQFDYEIFCYERWFIIREFMKSVSRPVWALDHDVLTFDGLTSVGDIISWSKYPEPFMFNSAWTSLISDIKPLELLTLFYCKVFSDREFHVPLSWKYAVEGRQHLSDMYLLFELCEMNPTIFPDVSARGEDIGIDGNIRMGKIAELNNGYKTIEWRQKIPYVKLKDGSYRRFYSLHFQGDAKWFMPFVAQVPFEDEQNIKEKCARMLNSRS